MEIYIDISSVLEKLSGSPIEAIAYLFLKGGQIVLLISLIWGFYFAYLYYKKRKYIQKTEYTLFAIDVPKDNEQSMKAIEELFNTLHGVKSTKTMWKKHILGEVQLWFGLEIISIEGYIQFLIRTPSKFNELIKAAIYAQYPDAELTEVEDYISLVPRDANSKESKYRGFGMDFYLKKPNYYPLKTYMNFEHSLTQTFIDPMASLLEILSKLGPGEFIGIMIMISPIDNNDLQKYGEKAVAKIMGTATDTAENLVDKISNAALKGIDKVSESMYQLWGNVEEQADKQFPMFKMLTPRERATVSAIETKIEKLNFEVRMKTCYIAPKDKFSFTKGYYGLSGAFKQFDDFNALKTKKTKANYLFIKLRTLIKIKRFLTRYVKRNFFETRSFTLSTEELATLYHFPQETVKAPLIKKAETKTVEPPTSLPLEKRAESEFMKEEKIDKKLETGEIIDFKLDSKYFESKFAKDKDKKEEYKKEFKKQQQEDSKPPSNLPVKKNQKNKPPSNLPIIE